MLYGNKAFVDKLKDDIRVVEKRQGFRTVFASTIGSISKGMQREDSDYDVRALYIWNTGMLEKDEYHLENRIRHREWYPERLYDCIAFWEIGAFLNFLNEPCIDSGYKYQLAKNVAWSFFSEYADDPYGISQLVVDAVKESVDPALERQYHWNVWGKTMERLKAEPSRKNLMNLLHAYLSIDWIDRTNELPPLNIKELLAEADPEMGYAYEKILTIGRMEAETMRIFPKEIWNVEEKSMDTVSYLRGMNRNCEKINKLILRRGKLTAE